MILLRYVGVQLRKRGLGAYALSESSDGFAKVGNNKRSVLVLCTTEIQRSRLLSFRRFPFFLNGHGVA